ncbi:uncharacterized protein [Leptinotarsa decemlineata]|uniref:uncharacterized protein n=1 Tax=Leptinotarsa decemlineata TaxID=7539 RepID=UPI003D309056
MHTTLVIVTLITVNAANIYQECARLYNPNNYMVHLPSLSLPYLGDVPIPNNMPAISPSPVVKTKAIKVVTKYIYKNPVCVKYTKKKGMCKQDNGVKQKDNFEQLVTKEYFVRDRKHDFVGGNNRHRRGNWEEGREKGTGLSDNNSYRKVRQLDEDIDYEGDSNDLFVKASESQIPSSKETKKTPTLSADKVEEMLIEDRLDQLETILPHYTRRRVFQTSTITVTKVLSNRKATATMLVKNCIPYGYAFCEPIARSRKSKVAETADDDNEHYYG